VIIVHPCLRPLTSPSNDGIPVRSQVDVVAGFEPSELVRRNGRRIDQVRINRDHVGTSLPCPGTDPKRSREYR